MVYLDRVNLDLFNDDENYTCNARKAVSFNPDVVFVPGNVVPSFIPGLKVEVFHGFEWKKKGHFRIRGCFDMYCTQGPFFTKRFEQLAQQQQFFDVVETGWCKLDPLFQASPLRVHNQGKPIILYAPTFSPKLTSVPALYEQLQALSAVGEFHIIVKFHPKMAQEWVDKFKAIDSPHLDVIDVSEIASVLQTADVILSDTSSIITEFLLLNKPAVTFNNAQPEPVLIDFTQPEALRDKLNEALTPSPERLALIKEYNVNIHPYKDGNSSQRILDAVAQVLENGKQHNRSKPLNWFRNLKMRKQLNYWQL